MGTPRQAFGRGHPEKIIKKAVLIAGLICFVFFMEPREGEKNESAICS